MSAENRAKILDTAKDYVCNDRATAYGEPEDNFQIIANLWTAYFKGAGVLAEDRIITPTDVALAQTMVKVARLSRNPSHKDSWIDIAGYSACGGDIALAPSVTYTESATTEEPIASTNKFKIGDAVWHPVHGRGRVTAVDFSTVGNFPYVILFADDNHLRPFTSDGRGRAGYADDYIALIEDNTVKLSIKPFNLRDEVYHPIFGFGLVIQIDTGANLPVKVLFKHPVMESRFTAEGKGHTGQINDFIMHFTKIE